jgi:hypothetical protein
VAIARARDLHRLDWGLALHFVSPLVYLVGVLASGLGCFFSVAAQSRNLESMTSPAHFFTFSACLCLLLVGGIEIVNTGLAMSTRGGVGRNFLTGAFGLYCAGSLLAALGMFLDDYRAAFLPCSLLLVTIAWAVWLGYLAAVGRSLGRPEISEQAGRTVMSAFSRMALTGIFWFIIGIGVWFAMLLGARWRAWFPGHLLLLTPASVGAAAKVTWYFGKFDSIVEFVLFPTGVPFALEYMNFIGGTRVIIDREA